MSLPGEFLSYSNSRPALLPLDNPLSMLSPLEDVVFDPCSGSGDGASKAFSVIPSPPPLPQLGFDTSDEQLPCFFSNLNNQVQVLEKLQQHLLLFLRNTLETMERRVGVTDACLGKIQPKDLMLCSDDPPLHAQDGVWYHRVRCPRIHGQEFSIKVSTAESAAPVSHLPQHSHINVQEVISHFPVPELVPVPERERGALQKDWPQEGSNQTEMQQEGTPEGAADERQPSVQSLLKQGYHVTVNRDLTQGHMEEFVLEGRELHRSQPEVYHKRLVLLLLQVTQALLHLMTHDIQVADLDPHRILLAWAKNEGDKEKLKVREIGELQKRNEEVNNRISYCARNNIGEKQKNEHLGKPEHLWMKWGTPRVVLTLPCTATTKSSQSATSHQIQLGHLLQHCLHLPEAQVSCINTLPDTTYSQGLLCLLSLLLSPKSQLQMADIVPFLQALLWGPRASLFQHSLPDPTTVHNWLQVKRSLLLLKLAERGLFLDQSAVDWEDYLCLQYFSLTDPHAVLNATAKLGLHNAEI